MRIVNPTTLAKDQSLQIGKQGENLATCIDFSDFLAACTAEYGSGTLALSHQRAEDSAPYAVSLDGALWKVRSSDLQYAGTGLCELTYTVGSVVKKSRHWKTNTHTALGQTVTPPAAWQAYIDAVTAKVAEVENMTVSATTLEAGASATVTKSTVGGVVHLSFGLPKGQDASVTAESITTALGFTPANSTALAAKQDAISDLSTIRSGAAAGATALQSYTETDPTVPSWAKSQTKPTYQANEIVMGDSTVGAEISDLIEAVAQKQDTLTDADKQSITKTGMTSGAAWSATEQAAARSRMGASGAYRHIATVTVTGPDTQFVTINTDSNGNPFELVHVIVSTSAPQKADDDTTANNGYFTFEDTNDSSRYYGAYPLKGTDDINMALGVFHCGTTPFFEFCYNVSNGRIAHSAGVHYSLRKDVSIQKVSEIGWRGNGKITVGTIFDVWGIDA